MKDLKIVYRKISELKPAEYNPRQLTTKQYSDLKASLERFGFTDPAIINTRKSRKNYIIGGHQRIKVWQEMGNDTAPCVEVDLSEKEERELNIRLNKNTGKWDYDILANEFDVDDLMEWGFEDFELDVTVEEPEPEAEDDNYEEPDNITTKIVLGDFIEIGEHRLVCGDSRKVETFDKLFGDNLADMVVTDPPYNVNYVGKTKDALKINNDSSFYEFLYDFYTSLSSYCKKGSAWYVWHADSEGINFRKAMIDSGILLKQCLIWKKSSMVMGRQDYHWKHEPCLYGWKDGGSHNWYSDRKQTTILEFDRPNSNKEHPTMKPVPLISYQIQNSSKNGDIVADAFGGSGTTMVAAHQIKRIAYLVENDPKYCQVIIDRMLKLDETLVVKINGKKYESD